MTEDIQPEVLKRTQETLGKFIKKPVLSEKLLRKPPFRFLHDICTSAMRETGFFEDTLSGNDVKVELINDKEGKIAFLHKVIAAVETANNVKLGVKPNKIVAGHEPIKTNEFLQALAFALEKQVETKLPKKTLRKTKITKPEPKEGQEETVKRKNVANKTPQKANDPTPEVPKKDPKKRKPVEKKPDKVSDEPKKKVGEKELKTKKKSEAKVVSNDIEAAAAVHENGILEDADDGRKGEGTVEKSEAVNGPEEEADGKQTEPFNRPVSAKFKKRTPSARPAVPDDPSPEQISFSAPEETANVMEAVDRVLGGVVNDNFAPDTPPSAAATPPPPAATVPLKAPTPIPASTPVPLSTSGAISKEPVAVARPRTAIRPPSARPASARPAAPRVRDRGQIPLQEELIKPAVGKVNLIVEQEAAEQDDEELVSVQTGQETADVAAESSPATFPTPADASEHGHLVSQILEAQKELEEDAFAKKELTGRTEIEWSSGRGVEGTRREVERLRAAVQTLTRAANPLGKLLEYLQEDVDSMQQELASWRERNANLSAKLEQERSLTDKSIEPLKSHLEELESSVRVELEQIGALKATVLRSDAKISTLLSGL